MYVLIQPYFVEMSEHALSTCVRLFIVCKGNLIYEYFERKSQLGFRMLPNCSLLFRETGISISFSIIK